MGRSVGLRFVGAKTTTVLPKNHFLTQCGNFLCHSNKLRGSVLLHDSTFDRIQTSWSLWLPPGRAKVATHKELTNANGAMSLRSESEPQ